MGSYRNYKFSIYKNDTNISAQEIFNSMCRLMTERNLGFWGIRENIEEIIEVNNGSVLSDKLVLVSYNPKKWIDRDKEMIILSKMFPDIIFKTFAVDHWNEKEAWNAYYKNGVSYYPKKYGKSFKEETLNLKIKKMEKIIVFQNQ